MSIDLEAIKARHAARRRSQGWSGALADVTVGELDALVAKVERLQSALNQLRETVGPDLCKLAEIDALVAEHRPND